MPSTLATAQATPTTTDTTTTTVSVRPALSIQGDRFLFDGQLTNPRAAAEGLLLNSRMVQAVIDIENGPHEFAYPDTGAWDAERNVSEFLEGLAAYAGHGLNAVTVNLQGGNPVTAPGNDRPTWVITAYEEDGTPKPDWLARLERVLNEAERQKIVVIVGLFYFGQDHRLSDEAAVLKAVDEITSWLVQGGWRNVIVEIGNESNLKYDHAILRPNRVSELIERIRIRSGGQILASTSFSEGYIPPADVIKASDIVLVHANGLSSVGLGSMLAEIRGIPIFNNSPRPIVINEDSNNLSNMLAAIEGGASWGFHDKGEHNYRDGFQVPPVNWSLSTEQNNSSSRPSLVW